jgi:predicted nucleic acid-binding protein
MPLDLRNTKKIDFLKEKDAPHTRKLAEIIDRDIPFGICPVIYLEVLRGAATQKDFDLLREYLGSLAFYDLRDACESAARAAQISFDLRRKGFATKSTIDYLIAQTAIDNDLYLLHNDADFNRIKQVSPLKTWEQK